MIRIVSFDLDGTLVRAGFVDLVWRDGVVPLYAEKSGMEYEAAKEYVLGMYAGVGDGRLEYYDLQYWLDYFQLGVKSDELLEIHSNKIKMFPEVAEVLESLHRDFQLVVTTNAPRDFVEVQLDGLSDLFTDTFSAPSDLKQVRKTPAMYGYVCRQMRAMPFEVLHIGDSYPYDYQAPMDAGLDAIFLDRGGSGQGVETVADLREAWDLIQNYA